MSEFETIQINTVYGYVKIQCCLNDTIIDIIKKVLEVLDTENEEYDWTYFGIQTEYYRSRRIVSGSNNFLCPKLNWCHLKLLLGGEDIYLAVKHYPAEITYLLQSSPITVKYLINQLKDQNGSILNEVNDLELALDLGCLIHFETLKNSINSSKSHLDWKSLFPAIVTEKIKVKNLKKFIHPKIADISALSRYEFLKRFYTAFQCAIHFDQDAFKCLLGAGEGIPVTIMIGPRINISLFVGSSLESRVIAYFTKIESVQVIITRESCVCQVKINLHHIDDPVIVTFDHIDDADTFVHLVDCYSGYVRLKSGCPLIQSKCSDEFINIPEIDKSKITRTKILDNGQFGDVYKGVYKQIDRDVEVAIKLCKADTTDEERQQFLSEAEIMMVLENPHIVQLFGISQGQECWIVMEFCHEGQLLNYLLENRQQLYEVHLLTFCYQISTAMAYLESKRIIHRDIAARNILLASSECAKLSDFGKAVYLGNEPFFQGGQEMLPIKWAAIECLAQRRFSIASDVWSFAVFMWEVLSGGRKPFADLHNNEVLPVLREQKRLPRLPNVTESFHMLLLACWSADPQKRPSFSLVKNKINDIKVEFKKMQADGRMVSMATGLNRKPPLKPSLGGSRSDLFSINQSMPDLVGAREKSKSSRYLLSSDLSSRGSRYQQYGTSGSSDSRCTLNSDQLQQQLESIFQNFRARTNSFAQTVSIAQSCSVVQLKGFGLAIRQFLQDMEQIIPTHPVDHQLTEEEHKLIQLFKMMIGLRIATGVNQTDMVNQMIDKCNDITKQTEILLMEILKYLGLVNTS